MRVVLGAIEAGGTKMVCAVGDETGRITERAVFPTLSPKETMPALIGFFASRAIQALGAASFGPLDLNPSSARFGYITATPKRLWIDYPLLPVLKKALSVPIGLDTDVNGAALGEARLGAAKGLSSCLYVTVGTGIGGGVVIGGAPVHGLMHPELGHILLKPDPDDPMPRGVCPYHESCLEGLASGPSIEKRWGKSAQELAKDHPAWRLEAEYLAQMCVDAMMMFSPEKIILGGGVMHQAHLYPLIRERVKALLNGYIRADAFRDGLDNYITAPGLGDHAGITGALLLAADALDAAGKGNQ